MTARESFLELMDTASRGNEVPMAAIALGMVALAEHLEAVPEQIGADWGEVMVVARELHSAVPTSPNRDLLAAQIIKKLDEYRAGKRGEG